MRYGYTLKRVFYYDFDIMISGIVLVLVKWGQELTGFLGAAHPKRIQKESIRKKNLFVLNILIITIYIFQI